MCEWRVGSTEAITLVFEAHGVISSHPFQNPSFSLNTVS